MKPPALLRTTLAVVALIPPVMAAACGKDDGATVRQIGTTGGTAASASASASGSGSGSGSGGHEEVACMPVGDSAEATATLKVTLKEWSVTPEQATIPAGKINIVADNQGDEPHEIVIVRADDPKTLPTIKDGGMDEEALGEDKIVGEIEAFPAKSTCNGVFDLTPGTYVLLCNVVEKEDNGEIHDHFFFGMAATITVT